ncbi:hypothetical protein KR018_002167 [Drosophila ironensis]|nr:hypothetical protein KR018_002167 [Drosophila ironensis]
METSQISLPGVGKTTLIQKICAKLQKDSPPRIRGFYTEEVRGPNGQRVGFDVVTLAGNRGILARENSPSDNRRPQVGKYSVYVQDFEDLVLPLLTKKGADHREGERELLVIDEVGKMELFSRRFEASFRSLLDQKTPLLVTIPLRANLPLVAHLKKSPAAFLFTVTKENRDALVEEIAGMIVTK